MKTQFHKALIAAGLAASLAGTAGSASAAQSYSFDFGTLVAGTYQPGATFANLSDNSANDQTFTFALLGDPIASLHVQGLTEQQGGSAWYTPATPIPEPEIYVMLLAGLGLIGAIAGRRRFR